VADFRNHASAADLLLNNFGAPDSAADRAARALNFGHFAATRVAGVLNTLVNNRAGNVSSDSLPFAAANIDCLGFSNRLHDCVAAVFVAGLSFCLPGCAANVAVAGLVDRLADVVANGAVAGLVDRLADVVANVFVAGLVVWFANIAGDCLVAGLVDRLADLLLNATVVSFIDRLADGVTFVSVAGVVHVACAGYRNRFCAAVIDRLHARVLLLFPDNFADGAVLWSASASYRGEIIALTACGGRAVRKTASSAQAGRHKTAVQQYGNCSSGSKYEPSHCLVPHLPDLL
jgi:hypothetical protein